MDQPPPHLHVHIHGLAKALVPVIQILAERIFLKLHTMDTKMSAEFDALTAEVHVVRDVAASAVTLINGIADRIAAAAGDPAATQALTDELRGSADALSAAVLANTPAPAP